MIERKAIDNNVAQGLAAYVEYLNHLRISTLMDMLDRILSNETNLLNEVDVRNAHALADINWARMNINNLIDVNRGGERGLHGFIAEYAEAGLTNARWALDGLKKTTIVLNNNGPADLLVNGKSVQVKFYSDLLNEMKVSADYRSMDMMFAKDHMEVYRKIMRGDREVVFNGQPLRDRQIRRIRQLIQDESDARGLPWNKWMRSSSLDYRQVQKGAIDRTLDGEIEDINQNTVERKTTIKNETAEKKAAAYQKSRPTLGEASKAAGTGAAVQGGLNFCAFVYAKHKDGKEIWEFNADDWKEGGIEAAQGAFKGGFSGYAIYGLTNVCHLPAPSAGAITAGTFGLIDAVMKLRSDSIDEDGFLSLVTMNAIDASGSAVGAAIGQTIIPIPVVGALIGSIISTTAISLGKGLLNKREQAILDAYQNKVDSFIATLDKQYRQVLDGLLNRYRQLGSLQHYAFDLGVNIQLRFNASIDLARFVGVEETSILHDESEIDSFFL